MAMWRTRTPETEQIAEEQSKDDEKPCREPEQKDQIVEEQLKHDEKSDLIDEDVMMEKVYSKELPMNVQSLMRMFNGEDLEHKVMSESGRLNYTTTAWEPVKPNVQERRVSYKFSRRVSIFGGEIMSTQQKSPLPNDGGWVVNEVMKLHGIPGCDQSRLHLRYNVEESPLTRDSCKYEIHIGVVWLKSPAFEAMITKNIISRFARLLEEILKLVEREIFSSSIVVTYSIV